MNNKPNIDTTTCRFCGEEIKAVAIVCRYCGMNLETGRSTRIAESPEAPEPVQQEEEQKEQILWTAGVPASAYVGEYIIGFVTLPLCLLGVWVWLFTILDRKYRSYELTNKLVRAKVGVLNRRVNEIELVNLRSVSIRSGFIDRMFGIGTVLLGTSGVAGVEVSLWGIQDPERVRDLIMAAKEGKLESTDSPSAEPKSARVENVNKKSSGPKKSPLAEAFRNMARRLNI